jgi:hypothetical protein
MKRSLYFLSLTDNSFCPKCGGNVSLLANTSLLPAHKNAPSFYICFGCNRVAQIGVGVVEEFDEDTFEFQENENFEEKAL